MLKQFIAGELDYVIFEDPFSNSNDSLILCSILLV